ncbi:hypothetical protein WMY93_030911 [Mugilogobius chulae]|uniref:Claudin n=1 Tax=Mugilogobius chulae TaxID=88201 RepID=A0AAW0MI87_9GOBI
MTRVQNYLLKNTTWHPGFPQTVVPGADHCYRNLTRAIRALNLCVKPWERNLPHLSKMVSVGRQMLGLVLATIGFLGSIIICALPMWIVTKFIGNIVTLQVIWNGLWMYCVIDFTGQIKCEVYDYLLYLPQHLTAARFMIVTAIIIGFFGVLLGVVGGKCTNFVDERDKSKVTLASGIVFLTAGLMVMIPVCWTAITIIQDIYNPVLVRARKWELGASLYIGWAAAGLLFLGGGLLCSSCPPRDKDDCTVKYSRALD